ncbi:unnamed protein product [Polarella glacialis]|uniref:C3H1-type domain-containing protein n=2 Tax=Polarella glacialis TaxID=89957 RepID=A0A813JJ16_POLGL|nr:unnamed protein product [Polarella glacialis]
MTNGALRRISSGASAQSMERGGRSQRRRSPVDPVTGQLTYWETPCPAWGGELGYCLALDACPFAHGREEVSYHPSKYKTRLCNGHDCRGEGACCFAHSDKELRQWAPSRYSYFAATSQSQQTARAGLPAGDSKRHIGGSLQALVNSAGKGVSQKQRFCASYPTVSQCRRGAACSFAHIREEVQVPLLSLDEENHEVSALTEEFFTRKFKTMWCPIGAQHDWQTCVYAHTYQDARRQPSIGYGPQPCPFWGKKETRVTYSQRCPLGLRCPYAHGAKEQLYHPKYFRTVICRDLQMKGCPRQRLCAFYHKRAERRRAAPDTCDYNKPLPPEAIDPEWGEQFLSPPIFQEGLDDEGNAAGGMAATGFESMGVGFSGDGFWPDWLRTQLKRPGDMESSRTRSSTTDSADVLGSNSSSMDAELLRKHFPNDAGKVSLQKAAVTDPLAAAVLGAWFGEAALPETAPWAAPAFYSPYLFQGQGVGWNQGHGGAEGVPDSWWGLPAKRK